MSEPAAPNRILFLCTGNFYRSRFAEALFNSLAQKSNLPWTAYSSGLALELGAANFGPISAYTRDGLKAKGIELAKPIRFPKSITRNDLENATRIIALNEEEHRQLIEHLFPDWVSKIEFWHIGDIDVVSPEQGIALIEQQVLKLIGSIESKA